MSCYIVEDNTINQIVSYIDHHRVYPFSVRGSSASIHALGKQMHQLNVDAVQTRYPDDPKDESRYYQYRHVLPPKAVTAYKALQCFLYQCCEGEISNTKLYRNLEKVLATIAHTIIDQMKEYQDAPWG